MAETISSDYLIIGSGDTDNRGPLSPPGRTLADCLPIRPSAFYGVNSKYLGQDSIDQVGWNVGLHELATADEICAYYDQLMGQRFLPSGRVQYYPNCEYEGDGRFHSKLSGKTFQMARTSAL